MPRLKYYNPSTEQWEYVVVGAQGEQGEQGDIGPANTLTVGTVADSAPGSEPEVTITGTAPNQTINFVLPTGDTGPQGETGNTGVVQQSGTPSSTDVLWLDTDEVADVPVPNGGTTGQVLAKSSNDDYDTEWTSLPEETMPTGGTAGQILSKIDGNDFNTEWITPAPTGNAIINGAFEINQRSFSSSTTNLTFGFDRWRQSHTGGTTTVSAQSFTPGAAPLAGLEGKSFVRIITTGQTDAGHFTLYGQKIESVRTFAGQTVTLSFYARAGSGTPSISNELVQNFGNGGSPSAAVLGISPNKFELSTSWQRFTAIIQVPSITGKTIGTTDDGFLELNFFVSGGSNFNARTVSLGVQNSTFEIWGVQLEAGSVATPFRRNAPSIQAELATCQRYYTRLIDPPGSGVGTGGTGGGASRVSVSLPVEMRVLPSISGTGTFSFWNGGAARSGTFNAVNVFSSKTAVEVEFDLDGAFTQGNAVKMYTQNSTSRFLELSAEL